MFPFRGGCEERRAEGRAARQNTVDGDVDTGESDGNEGGALCGKQPGMTGGDGVEDFDRWGLKQERTG